MTIFNKRVHDGLGFALLTVLASGCAQRPKIPPTEFYAILADDEHAELNAEERQLYDAALAGSLIGASVADYQAALEKADRVFGKSSKHELVSYAFELVPAAKCEEGPPMMSIHTLDGKIVSCRVGCPEF